MLDGLLDGACSGRGGALVVRGRAGAGKSALLEHLAQRAGGCLVVRAAGTYPEMGLAFAGLHQLCAPMLGHLGRLPKPQQEALAVAFALSGGMAPDRFFVGLAALGLLAEAAQQQPLVCVVDDGQWLDRPSAQALGFVGRRLRAQSVALVVAMRGPSEHEAWRGLPELVLAETGGNAQAPLELHEAELSLSRLANAILYNGLGRYDDALVAARQARHAREPGVAQLALVELIEAATRSGRLGLGADALERLAEATQAGPTNWAFGMEARSRALLAADDSTAEPLYREAIDRLARSQSRAELARAHLLYGEWLRRQRRRLDAREQLRTAHALFTAMSAGPFAERAARELLATGETTRRRSAETRDELTPREREIAQLACDGLSNPAIGVRLFISRRTVEYHLQKVFRKLGISSRHQLERALGAGAGLPAVRRAELD